MDRTRDTGGATTLDLEQRRALYRAEAAAAEDARARALLGWADADAAEDAGDLADAVRAYLEAYNAAPSFRPPLFDLVRIFEQRRSYRNLKRLYDAERKAALSPRERASALADLAVFLSGPGADPAKALDAQRQSLAHLRESDEGDGGIALLGLRLGRERGDRATVRASLRELFRALRSPEVAAEVAIELALEQVANDNVTAAMDALAQGQERLGPLPALLVASETLARKHGLPDVLAEALTRWADGVFARDEGVAEVEPLEVKAGAAVGAGAEAAATDAAATDAAATEAAATEAAATEAAATNADATDADATDADATDADSAAGAQDDGVGGRRRAAAVARYLEAAAIRRQSGQSEEARGLLERARELAPGSSLVALEYAVQAIDAGASASLRDPLEGLASDPSVEAELVAGLALRGALDLQSEGEDEASEQLLAIARDQVPHDLLLRRMDLARALREERFADAIGLLEAEGATAWDRLRALVLRRVQGERGRLIAERIAELPAEGLPARTRRLLARWRAEEGLAGLRSADDAQARLAAVADLEELLEALVGNDAGTTSAENAGTETASGRAEAAIWARDLLSLTPPAARARALARALAERQVSALPDSAEAQRLLALTEEHDPEQCRVARIALGEGTDELRLVVQAWLSAAEVQDSALVAALHDLLALRLEELDEGRHAAVQRAGAARAWLRAGDADAALSAARRAPESLLGARYADVVVEELLRARGDLAGLREVVEAGGGASAQEMLLTELLRAAAAAQVAGDLSGALEKTREALRFGEELATDVVWRTQLTLAEATGDEALRVEALAHLGDSAPIRALEHAEATGDRRALEALVEDPTVGRASALRLLVEFEDVEPELVGQAIATLRGDADHPELHALALTLGAGPRAATRPVAHDAEPKDAEPSDDSLARDEDTPAALEEPSSVEPSEDASPLAALGGMPRALVVADLFVALEGARGDARARLLRALAAQFEDETIRAELSLAAMRCEMMDGGAEVLEDAFFEVEELVELAAAGESPWQTSLADTARDDTITEADDAELRADALEGRDDPGGTVYAAFARAASVAGRGDALAALESAVEADPADYGSWEALRRAARSAGRWELVVDACERLALPLAQRDDPEVRELRADLLEEAGVVLFDRLQQPERARGLLTEAFLQSPARRATFLRLYELESGGGATDGLLALVDSHLPTLAEDARRQRLLYEKARIHRARGELDAAVAAIGALREYDALHAGGLALLVEIATTRDDWAGAVAALRDLARSDVPVAQRRIAHLGAADFLEQRLGDPAGALQQLRAVEALGLADAALYERMGELAEAANDDEELARSYARAAAVAASPAERAELMRRAAARAIAAGNTDAAIRAFREVLSGDPTDLDAARGLHQLLPEGERVAQAETFVRATREALAEKVTVERLRALAEASPWAGERELRTMALAALQVLGVASEDERRVLAAAPPPALRVIPAGIERVTDERWAALPEATRKHFAETFEVTREAFARSLGRGPEALELKREHRLAPGAAWHGFAVSIAAAFGLQVDEVFAAPLPGNASFVFASRRDHVGVVLGEISAESKPGLVAALTRQAYYARRGAEALMGLRREETLAWICGAFAIADAPLAAGRDLAGVVEATRNLQPFVGRRAKRSLAALSPRMPGAKEFREILAEYRRGAAIAALVATGDIARALREVAGGSITAETLSYEPAVASLLSFAFSEEFAALRARGEEIP